MLKEIRMNYSLKEEEVTISLINEMLPLLEEHRLEISAFTDMRLNPCVEQYVTLYAMGMYKVYVARDNTNKIIAYAGYFVQPNFHYQDYTYATQDVVYVQKTRRGAMMGSRLLGFADEQLQLFGVDVVTHHVKVKQDFGVLLQRLGYKWIEKIYMKRLK